MKCHHQRQVDLDHNLLPCAWPDCHDAPLHYAAPHHTTVRLTMNSPWFGGVAVVPACTPHMERNRWVRERMSKLNPSTLPWEPRTHDWYFWRLEA